MNHKEIAKELSIEELRIYANEYRRKQRNKCQTSDIIRELAKDTNNKPLDIFK